MPILRRKSEPQPPSVIVRIETPQPQQVDVLVKQHSRRLPIRSRSPEEQRMRNDLRVAKLRAKIKKLTPPAEVSEPETVAPEITTRKPEPVQGESSDETA